VGRSGGSFEGARVNSFGRVIRARAVSKMLSCDPRLALCTFVQLVCPALPCRFVWVVRAPMQNHSGGSFEGARVNSFGRVVRVGRLRGARVNLFGRVVWVGHSGGLFEGARVNSFERVVRVGRSGGSFEGARVNSFGRVVWVGHSGGSFEGACVNSFGRVVRVGHSGGSFEGAPCELVRARPVSKMLSCDPRLALCMFVHLVFPALPCRFVSVVRAPMKNHSGGSFEGARVNSFGRVVRSGGSFGRVV
jgi:hypothetical protein